MQAHQPLPPVISSFERSLLECRIDKQPHGTRLLMVRCPYLPKGYTVAIVGETKELGRWNPKKSLPFTRTSDDLCTIAIDELQLADNVQFKLILYKASSNKTIWEEGDNRHFHSSDGAVLEFRGTFPLPRAAGVAIPVFSLITERSLGIGDFGDLEKFIEWSASCGLKVVQLLPLNDTTSTRTYKDSYPYNAISAIALHPLYLSINKMGNLKDAELSHVMADNQQRLNRFDEVDYEGVDDIKWQFFRAIYEQDGKKTIRSNAFVAFFEDNREWLVPYSVFCYLRDANHTENSNGANFHIWSELSEYKAAEVANMCTVDGEHYCEIMFHAFLQFHLHTQLLGARDIAHKNGVSLKGDIPIGVSPLSVEAWSNPELFNTSLQAGAPPDAFATEGQNWGFPTYNWAKMKEDGYSWWQKRFQKMAQYFDLYRIDHILGFFRIWSIQPQFTSAIMGQFNPAKPFSQKELIKSLPNFSVERFIDLYITFDSVKLHLGRYANFYAPYLDKRAVQGVKLYEFKEEFNTQRKIADFFATQEQSEANTELCAGLCALHSELLFVPDIHNPQAFHPRIAAQYTTSYQLLNQEQKDSYNRLYNDFFYTRHNDLWAATGRERLSTITRSTSMLCCGEDLGMIPDCVAPVMRELGILSLEVERMPKGVGAEFARVEDNPYLSVDTISTHDMSPLRLWWEELSNESMANYFYNTMHFSGNTPDSLSAARCRDIVEKHFASGSMLVILAWQDLLAIDGKMRHENPGREQINIPSNPNHAWQYRTHLSVRKMKMAEPFTRLLNRIVENADR